MSKDNLQYEVGQFRSPKPKFGPYIEKDHYGRNPFIKPLSKYDGKGKQLKISKSIKMDTKKEKERLIPNWYWILAIGVATILCIISK